MRRICDSVLGFGLLLALGVVILLDRSSAGSLEGKQQTGGGGGTGGLLSTSIYGLRTAANREEWIQDVGGTQISEQAVVEGLDWLARHQAEDGSWSSRCLGSGPGTRCEPRDACRDPGQPYVAAQTGLPLLALQAGGHYYFNDAKHSKSVRRGLDWLVEHQKSNGALHQMDSSVYMYEHGIATFALAEACAVAKASRKQADPKYETALRQAVYFLISQQHDDGGWRYNANPALESDSSVTGWQMLALKTAKEAGVDIPPDALKKLEKFFASCEMGDRGRSSYLPGVRSGQPHTNPLGPGKPVIQPGMILTEATTGVGMMAHQFLLKQPDSELVREAAPYLADFAEREWKPGTSFCDYYLWYNCTVPMYQVGGEPWDRWNGVVRERLIELQEHQGCERGSWPVHGHFHNVAGGRIYTTSLAILTLETYYRFAKATNVKKAK